MQLFLKHRVLSIASLLLTLLVAVAAYAKLPATYEASSNVVLIPSASAAVKVGEGNPYLAFSSSVNQLADVVRYEATDWATRQALFAAGYTSSYAITDAANTPAPVLVVTVTGADAADVGRTLSGVTRELSVKLSALQARFKPNDQVQDQTISYTSTPAKLTGKKFRPLLVIVVVLLLISFSLLLVVDAMQSRRKTLAAATRPSGSDGSMAPSPAAQAVNWAGTGFQDQRPSMGARRPDDESARGHGGQEGYRTPPRY